jgi:DNA polymerase/3'-5' exonuclease PolX
MNKTKIIDVLTKLTKQYQLDTSLKFKTIALNKAIYQLKQFNGEITSGKQAIADVKSIGKGLGERIDEIIKTGTLSELKTNKETSEQTTAMDELLSITGIGPTRAKQYIKDGITSVNKLHDAIKDDKIKITHHIQIGIDYYEDLTHKIPRKEIDDMKKTLHKEINKVDKELVFEICGSYRRGLSKSGDIDLLISHPHHISTIDKQKYLPKLVTNLKKCGFIIDSLTSDGAKKYMGVCRIQKSPYARRIDIRCVDYSAYYTGLLYFTGSKNFNILVRKKALENGYSLNEYSLTNKETDEKIILQSEKELFDILDMEYVKPTDRDI